jgi:DNA mismatch repair ATPase MutS
MFVPADAFRANVGSGVFTHYRREEDATMTRGKFDEELNRASAMVDAVSPGALVLFNESFASTNEREGAEIAAQLVHALLDSGVKVAYVTHMYELAHSLWSEGRADAEFLRAERLADGRRTFRLIEGEPLPTSHGVDLYRRIFDAEEIGEAAAPGL